MSDKNPVSFESSMLDVLKIVIEPRMMKFLERFSSKEFDGQCILVAGQLPENTAIPIPYEQICVLYNAAKAVHENITCGLAEMATMKEWDRLKAEQSRVLAQKKALADVIALGQEIQPPGSDGGYPVNPGGSYKEAATTVLPEPPARVIHGYGPGGYHAVVVKNDATTTITISSGDKILDTIVVPDQKPEPQNPGGLREFL